MSGKPADQDNSIEEILASIRQIISEDEPKEEEATNDIPAAVLPDPVPVAAPAAPTPAPEAKSAQSAIDDVFELVDRVVAEEEPAPEPQPIEVALKDAEPEPEPVVVAQPEPEPVVVAEPEPVVVPEPEPEPEPVVVAAVVEPPVAAVVAPAPAPTPASVVAADPVAMPSPPSVMEHDDMPIFTDTAANATVGAFSKLTETILIERQRAISGATVTLEDIVKDLLAPLLRTWIDQHVPGMVERLVREELEKLARQARDS